MPENIKVSTIFFCPCLFRLGLECVENQKMIMANDIILFVIANTTHKILIEYFNKNLCFFCLDH